MAFDDTAGDVAAPQFGFQDPAKFPNVGNGPVWVKTYNGSAVTPAAQYLIIHVGNGTTITDGSKEWAFVGTTVPEPASLGLIGLMALALNRRRHNS
jgi:hypothetical protein